MPYPWKGSILDKRLLTGNEALALAALHAGVRVVTGYPGTPSTRALSSLLAMQPKGTHVEWSVNEKVALEVAAGASWAGQRALCTTKMSGLNVALDTLISVAYSGCVGGLVVYVADDPGVQAGMAEQDSRALARMCDLPMLDPPTPAQAYRLTRMAFDLSERVGTPVLVRLVTGVAEAVGVVELEEAPPVPAREAVLIRDIARFTKAGAAVCSAQHRDLLERLERAGRLMSQMGLNELHLAAQPGGLGVIAAGVVACYLEEGLEQAVSLGLQMERVSVLRLSGVHPVPAEAVGALLDHCDTLLVLEELEPHVEGVVYVEAQRRGYHGRIVGKLDGTLERVGEYGVRQVVQGVGQALGLALPAELLKRADVATGLAVERPITVCAGCPHRGTFMAINRAIRRLGLKKDQVMVTGDIGCTILGMNPPFRTVWNEVSMGASIGLAQGFVHGGVRTPVIATIGDSTFFHAGMPALVNAVQHQVNLTVIIMDNGWTSMTGMQVNPGTAERFQQAGDRRVDLAEVVPALGVNHFFVMDPFDLEGSVATIGEALSRPGVKVILARQECAIQAQRRGERAGRVEVVAERCTLCKLCISVTGCPALGLGEKAVTVDPAQCYGCGLCAQVCRLGALRVERGARAVGHTMWYCWEWGGRGC